MKRAILLSLGWLLSAVVLYAALVALELYWNLYDWQPKLDWNAAVLIFGMLAALAALGLLARAGKARFSRGVSLAICLALLALAVYVVRAEPLTQGLFARGAHSPLWYRVGRFVVLALPGVFWGLGWVRWWRSPAN
jgi:peptidoglycan biosynthesis protein MviN/MurJ (putative lipid II flippase)